MNKSTAVLIPTISRYHEPLKRYARFLVKDQTIAAALVKEIFEIVFDENGFTKTEDELRHQLKNYTLKACRHWLRMQAIYNPQNN